MRPLGYLLVFQFALPAIMRIEPIPAFTDNYFWAIRVGNHAAIVDPGDAAPVIDYLTREKLELCAILVTHHHPDHIGGIANLLELRDVPVFGPANDPVPTLTRKLVEGDTVTVDALGVEFTVLDIPGHTRGHIAYLSGDALFCGDTLFAGGCGRVFEGTMPQMRASLAKLKALPPNTRVYCAHEYTLSNLRFAVAAEPGNAALLARQNAAVATRAEGHPTVPSTIALERETNPFLRWDQEEIISCAAGRLNSPKPSADEVFTSLREWKNVF
jgi:hydroxyacylglutathione hydrolase